MMLFDRITKSDLYKAIDAYQTQLQNTFHENTALEGKVAELKAENKRLESELMNLKTKYEKATVEFERLYAEKEELEEDLIDERHRHDTLQDFEVAEAQELAELKQLRENLFEFLRPCKEECCCDECTCHCEPEDYDPIIEDELEQELEYEAMLDEGAEHIAALEKFVDEFGEDCTPEPCKLTYEELEDQVENLSCQCSEYFHKAVEADVKAAKWEQMCKELVCGFLDITVNEN